MSTKTILSDLLYITLATVMANGLPWNTPYAAFDEAYDHLSSPDELMKNMLESMGEVFLLPFYQTIERQ